MINRGSTILKSGDSWTNEKPRLFFFFGSLESVFWNAPVWGNRYLAIDRTRRLSHCRWLMECINRSVNGNLSPWSNSCRLPAHFGAKLEIQTMLRDTARKFLLLYLIVDVIINPVDLASGKSTRCSEISFLGLNLPTICYHPTTWKRTHAEWKLIHW